MSNSFEMATTLTQRQRQALEILAKAERPFRNKDFHERFETDGRRTTGWPKHLDLVRKLDTMTRPVYGHADWFLSWTIAPTS